MNMDSDSNIRVVARVRPNDEQAQSILPKDKFYTVCAVPGNKIETTFALGLPQEKKKFLELDHVFGPNASQAEVYEKTCKDLIQDDLCEGYNVTIIACKLLLFSLLLMVKGCIFGSFYGFCFHADGKTGSGKTHTMGCVHGNSEDEGIIPRAIRALFSRVGKTSGATVKISFLEVYGDKDGDKAYDILQQPQSSQTEPIATQKNNQSVRALQKLTWKEVNSPEIALQCIASANKNRRMAPTNLNKKSSRSHAICTISITLPKGSSSEIRAHLTLVDLAGNENTKQAATHDNDVVDKKLLAEGIAINKGLTALADVISSLSNMKKGQEHVNYRGNLLTQLLKESLGGRIKQT